LDVRRIVIVAETIWSSVSPKDIHPLRILALPPLAVQVEVGVARTQATELAAVAAANACLQGPFHKRKKPRPCRRAVPLEILRVAADRDKFFGEALL
jgi:hypothetical protein